MNILKCRLHAFGLRKSLLLLTLLQRPLHLFGLGDIGYCLGEVEHAFNVHKYKSLFIGVVYGLMECVKKILNVKRIYGDMVNLKLI